jgi:cell wall-associated NlpC family hydrolase
MNVITGADIVDEAREWIGTPYVHQQARKQMAADCIGLVRGIGRDLDVFDFDENNPEHRRFLAYPMGGIPKLLVEALNKYFIRVRWTPQYGDIVLFSIDNRTTHVGIISDPSKGTVVHALARNGKVVEARVKEALMPAGVWRYPRVYMPQGWTYKDG